MAVSREAEEFAERLRGLKGRTERSYGALARRLNVSASTLHRYCSGEAVPVTFAPVERLARLCGASPEEQVELHRLWIVADAARRRPSQPKNAAAAPEAGPDPGPGPTREPASAAGPDTQDAVPSPAPVPAPAAVPAPVPAPPAPPPTPSTEPEAEAVSAPPPGTWYRRYRWPVTAAAAIAVILTLVALDSIAPRAGGGTPASGSAATTGAGGHGAAGSAGTSKGGPKPSGSASSSASARPSGKASGPSGASGSSTGSGGASGPRKAPAPPGGGSGTQDVPLTWTTRSHVWRYGCDHVYLIDRPMEQVPRPPVEQDAEAWASSLGAVHGRDTLVRITVQGRSSSAVVLEALRVRIVGRSTPVKRNAYFMDNGCGGALTPRSFDVDLDASRPVADPRAGHDGENEIPAVRFPYRVSADDPEVLLVNGRTVTCDCRWYLELEWSSEGRSGAVRIDDHGAPFRTSGTKGMPEHGYDSVEGRWMRN